LQPCSLPLLPKLSQSTNSTPETTWSSIRWDSRQKVSILANTSSTILDVKMQEAWSSLTTQADMASSTLMSIKHYLLQINKKRSWTESLRTRTQSANNSVDLKTFSSSIQDSHQLTKETKWHTDGWSTDYLMTIQESTEENSSINKVSLELPSSSQRDLTVKKVNQILLATHTLACLRAELST